MTPSGVDVGRLGIEVPVGAGEGLPFEAVVRVAFPRPGFVPCTWVTLVGPGDLVERIGAVPTAKLCAIEEAITSGDLAAGQDGSENAAAQSTLAEIRQALRRGVLPAAQITR